MQVTRSMQWVETNLRELPTYESFIYTLDMTPKTCYTSEELRQGVQQVVHTVEFADKHPTIDVALQTVKEKIVAEIPLKDANSHQCGATSQRYSLTRDPNDDITNINILESEGSWDIATPKIPSNKVKQPLEIRKVNIAMIEDPKFANVGN